MGKHYYAPAGQIIQGKCQGHYITCHETGKYLIIDSNASYYVFKKPYPIEYSDFFGPTWSDVSKWLREHTIGSILSSNIDRIVDVGSVQTGANAGDVVAGGLMFGAIGAIAGATRTSSSATLAVYMKNGDKYLIKFRSIEECNRFKEKMFVF